MIILLMYLNVIENTGRTTTAGHSKVQLCRQHTFINYPICRVITF